MNNFKRVDLHPATIKHLKNGHFWVTADSFTNKFPKNETFLIGVDSKTKSPFGVFLNDPGHKHVKARLFSTNLTIDFEKEIINRIKVSIEKRAILNLKNERENFLIINGENDGLPGLLVILLKDQIIIQYYAFYWPKFEKIILETIKHEMILHFPQIEIKDFWIQERNFEQKKSIRSINKNELPEFTMEEFGIKYLIRINAYYDYGIYTDMSAIRKQILPYLKNKKSALNLFCYTGAYSLFALKNGFSKVTSVDLSNKYLSWLEENILLNPDLDIHKHQSINLSVEIALKNFINNNEKFDFILSDPPSSSSDGNSRDNAFNAYEKLLPLMLKSLSNDGALIVFLNTHQISWNKFEEKLKNIIDQSEFKNLVTIGKRFKLSEDYLPAKGFYEGDYLKGILIEFKNKGTL